MRQDRIGNALNNRLVRPLDGLAMGTVPTVEMIINCTTRDTVCFVSTSK